MIEPHEEGPGHGVDRAAHDPNHNWRQQKLQIVMRWMTGFPIRELSDINYPYFVRIMMFYFHD